MQVEPAVTVAVVLIGLFFLGLAFFMIFLVLFTQKRRFDHAKKILALENSHSEALLESKLEIQEETFRNISQEIHDNIGQVLSFVKLNLNTLKLHGGVEDEDKLLQSRGLLTRAIQDLRNIARMLDTDFVKDMGMAEAIGQQLAFLGRSGAFNTAFEEDGGAYRLDTRVELVVFRVVQEALNNIVKHAGATAIGVRILYSPDRVMVEILDNGMGFALADLTPVQGLGLRNMINRMSLIKGSIQIGRRPEGGSRATIELPKHQPWNIQTLP